MKIEHRLPTQDEFIALRSGVSWGVPTSSQARDALAASLGGVIAVKDGRTIGMARVIGDGILNVYIQDVIVMDGFQKQGTGEKLVSALIETLSETCPANCLVGLFAAERQDSFYMRFGFTARPQSGFGPGMHAALSTLMHFPSGHINKTLENRQTNPVSDTEETGIALAKARGAA